MARYIDADLLKADLKEFNEQTLALNEYLKLFEEKRVRAIWDDKEEKWYFSISDVVAVLTDSVNPADYLKKMRKRDPLLAQGWGQFVTPLLVSTAGGMQKVNFADTEAMLRIIQSIPSPKAEPFKLWIARVASERLEQMQDPELSINQALMDYKRLGYSDNWINQRLKSIEIRKELTDEWKKRGLQEGVQFATLTDIIYQTWADMTAREYKQFKGLKKENLRDNMTNKELVLNMLAELSTKEISENRNPETYNEHKQIARQGGEIARNARIELEEKSGKKVEVVADDAEVVEKTAADIIEGTKDYILKELSKNLKGYDLEDFVANLLEAMGYRAEVSQHGGDSGIDITAYKDELPPRILVQVKSSDSDIRESTIQSLKGAMREGDYGLFITLANYTKNAQNYLKNTPIIRGINGTELVELILKYYDGLSDKYRQMIPLQKVYIPNLKSGQ